MGRHNSSFPPERYPRYLSHLPTISLSLREALTRTASLASSIALSSSFLGRYSHRSFPIYQILVPKPNGMDSVPDFCISRQASFILSSPPFRPKALTFSLTHNCFRLPSGTSETGCPSVESGKDVLRSSEVSWRSCVWVLDV